MWTHSLLSNVVLGTIALLAGLSVGIAIYLYNQRIGKPKERTPSEQFEAYVKDLIEECNDAAKKLRRASRASRWINFMLSAIEIIGGGYFAIASGIAAIGVEAARKVAGDIGGGQGEGQLILNLVVGFSIVVASGFQHRYHPESKSLQLDLRAWRLESSTDTAELGLFEYRHRSDANAPRPPLPQFLHQELAKARRPFSTYEADDHDKSSHDDSDSRPGITPPTAEPKEKG